MNRWLWVFALPFVLKMNTATNRAHVLINDREFIDCDKSSMEQKQCNAIASVAVLAGNSGYELGQADLAKEIVGIMDGKK